MPDYAPCNKIIKNFISLFEEKISSERNNIFNYTIENIEKETKNIDPEMKILNLFSPDMDSLSAKIVLNYYIHLTRNGYQVNEKIRDWVLDALEKSINGMNFMEAFCLKEKRTKINYAVHVQIRAYFEILRRKNITFQESQEICAEKWGVSETTVATIAREIDIPETTLEVLEALSTLNLSFFLNTAK